MWPNLTDSEEMEQAIAKVGEKYGRLDILVNNAGVSQSTKLEDYQPEDFAGIMNPQRKRTVQCHPAGS